MPRDPPGCRPCPATAKAGDRLPLTRRGELQVPATGVRLRATNGRAGTRRRAPRADLGTEPVTSGSSAGERQASASWARPDHLRTHERIDQRPRPLVRDRLPVRGRPTGDPRRARDGWRRRVVQAMQGRRRTVIDEPGGGGHGPCGAGRTGTALRPREDVRATGWRPGAGRSRPRAVRTGAARHCRWQDPPVEIIRMATSLVRTGIGNVTRRVGRIGEVRRGHRCAPGGPSGQS